MVFKILTGVCAPVIDLKYKERDRSSEQLFLETHGYKTKYGKQFLSYNGPRLWNALPEGIRKAQSVDTYKTLLKTYIFSCYDELIK